MTRTTYALYGMACQALISAALWPLVSQGQLALTGALFLCGAVLWRRSEV